MAPTISIIEFEAGDDLPERFSVHNSLAFAMYGSEIEPMILLNGAIRDEEWFTNDHLDAIIAHELGHIRCNTENEERAEHYGMALLIDGDRIPAYKLLNDRGVCPQNMLVMPLENWTV